MDSRAGMPDKEPMAVMAGTMNHKALDISSPRVARIPAVQGAVVEQGGMGATAGDPDTDGDAGTISVFTVTEPRDVAATAVGGKAGKPGKPGSGARGGRGGHGGRQGHWRVDHHGHGASTMEFVYNGNYPNGPGGAKGQDGQVVPGQDGNKATVTIQLMDNIQATIAADSLLFAHLQLMMQVVKVHYLDRDFQRAKNVLAWIFGLTAGRDKADYAAKWEGLHRQAGTYLSRLARGLDFFGNAANFVPLASFGLYCSTVTPMLTLGGTVQTVFDTYTQYLKDQTAGYNDFTRVYNTGTQAIQTYKDAIAATIDQRKKLWDECLQLDSQVAAAQKKMLVAETSFKEAVEARENCMKFNGIVSLIASLASFPAEVSDVAKKVGESPFSGASIKFATTLPSSVSGVCKTINILKSDFSDVAAQWDKTQAALEADGPDSAKLAADAAAVDDDLAPYMSMPAAQAYRAAIRTYVNLCNARNTKVIQCSKLDEDVLQLNGQITQTQAQMGELQSVESGKLDPTLAPYRTFLLGLYNNYKDSVMDKLFYETMAYRYRTLQDFKKLLQSGNTLAELSVMQGQILQAVIDYENAVNTIEQPFDRLDTHPMSSATEDSIVAFRHGGELVFCIPVNETAFQGLAHIQLTKFAVSLPGVRFTSGNKKVYLSLKCHGDSTVVDPNSGTVSRFTHNAVVATYEYAIIEKNGKAEERYLAGGALVDSGDGQDQKSISLSPFCTWSLNLPAKLNAGVDVSQVKDVILSFGGKGMSMLSK